MKFAFYNSSDGVYKLVTNNSATTGGAIKQQWLLAQTLVANGHEIVFIIPTPGPKKNLSEINGVRFVSSPQTTTNLTLRRIFSEEKPAWLYWRTNSMHLGPCFFIAKSLGISLAFACASDKDCDPKHALNPFSYRKYLWPLYQWGLNLADRILVQHPGQLELLGHRYAVKTQLVNNIVDIPHVAKHPAVSPYIAWVGNLRLEKRPDVLVEIAKQLPQYKFVVCGAVLDHRSRPGYGQSISQTLSTMPKVDYRGAVPPHEALDIIASASLFLSTSEQEGFPNTMLEAWCVGVPVVSLHLDIGGTITDHTLGRVTRDVTDTVTSIIHLMNTPQELTRLGENSKRYVLENHSPSVVYSQLADALHF